MAESENDYEDDHEGLELKTSPKKPLEYESISTKSKTVLSKGAGPVVSTPNKRKSRRKQSDPRRLGNDEIVNIEVEIKTEVSDEEDDNDDGIVDRNTEINDNEEHFNDDVFLKVRTKMLTSTVPGSELVSERSKKCPSLDQSMFLVEDGDRKGDLQKVVVENVDCQPQDLSIGKKKRDGNRVILAIPAVIRPNIGRKVRDVIGNHSTETTNSSSPSSSSCHSHHLANGSQSSSHRRYRTLAQEGLQAAEGSLIALERDYRIKYGRDNEDEFPYKCHSDFPDHQQECSTLQPFALSHHQQKLSQQLGGLEPDCNSCTPDQMCNEHKDINGKSSPSTSTSSSSSTSHSSKATSMKPQRSYKNLSRSRRIVANARERNRVHTISSAFEGLRRAVPSYSHNQKLSKLAILRIACSYILALAKLADLDYSPDDEQQMSFEDCVDLCTETLQAEGRSKRRKGPIE